MSDSPPLSKMLGKAGWCIIGPKGLFRHGLGEEYYSSSKWLDIGSTEYTIYVERSGAESVLTTLLILRPDLIGALHIEEVLKLPNGMIVLKNLVEVFEHLGINDIEALYKANTDAK